MKLPEELALVLERERVWRKHCSGYDSGSYCENPSQQYIRGSKVHTLYRQLYDALLEIERYGDAQP